MTSEARTALYSRLVEVLGDAPAATLMSYLPGSEPATASGLAEVEGRITLRMDRFEQRMEHFELRMDRFEQHLERVDGQIVDIHSALREMSDRFHADLRSQTRTVILATMTAVVTLGSATVAVATTAL
jgi:hypothetical protein